MRRCAALVHRTCPSASERGRRDFACMLSSTCCRDCSERCSRNADAETKTLISLIWASTFAVEQRHNYSSTAPTSHLRFRSLFSHSVPAALPTRARHEPRVHRGCHMSLVLQDRVCIASHVHGAVCTYDRDPGSPLGISWCRFRRALGLTDMPHPLCRQAKEADREQRRLADLARFESMGRPS